LVYLVISHAAKYILARKINQCALQCYMDTKDKRL